MVALNSGPGRPKGRRPRFGGGEDHTRGPHSWVRIHPLPAPVRLRGIVPRFSSSRFFPAGSRPAPSASKGLPRSAAARVRGFSPCPPYTTRGSSGRSVRTYRGRVCLLSWSHPQRALGRPNVFWLFSPHTCGFLAHRVPFLSSFPCLAPSSHEPGSGSGPGRTVRGARADRSVRSGPRQAIWPLSTVTPGPARAWPWPCYGTVFFRPAAISCRDAFRSRPRMLSSQRQGFDPHVGSLSPFPRSSLLWLSARPPFPLSPDTLSRVSLLKPTARYGREPPSD